MSATLDEAGTVRHALNEVSLLAYLQQHVRPFAGELRVRQFSHGQSNPTYLLECGMGHEGGYRCVLRKKRLRRRTRPCRSNWPFHTYGNKTVE